MNVKALNNFLKRLNQSIGNPKDTESFYAALRSIGALLIEEKLRLDASEENLDDQLINDLLGKLYRYTAAEINLDAFYESLWGTTNTAVITALQEKGVYTASASVSGTIKNTLQSKKMLYRACHELYVAYQYGEFGRIPGLLFKITDIARKNNFKNLEDSRINGFVEEIIARERFSMKNKPLVLEILIQLGGIINLSGLNKRFDSLRHPNNVSEANGFHSILATFAKFMQTGEMPDSMEAFCDQIDTFLGKDFSVEQVRVVVFALLKFVIKGHDKIEDKLLKRLAKSHNELLTQLQCHYNAEQKSMMPEGIICTLWDLVEISKAEEAAALQREVSKSTSSYGFTTLHTLNLLIGMLHTQSKEANPSLLFDALKVIGMLLTAHKPTYFYDAIELHYASINALLNVLAQKQNVKVETLVKQLWGDLDSPVRKTMFELGVKHAGLDLEANNDLTSIEAAFKAVIPSARKYAQRAHCAAIGSQKEEAKDKQENDFSILQRAIAKKYMQRCQKKDLYRDALKAFKAMKQVRGLLTVDMINDFIAFAVEAQDFETVLTAVSYLADSTYRHYDLMEFKEFQAQQILRTASSLQAGLKYLLENHHKLHGKLYGALAEQRSSLESFLNELATPEELVKQVQDKTKDYVWKHYTGNDCVAKLTMFGGESKGSSSEIISLFSSSSQGL